MVALPLGKLALLAVKQVAKPIAKALRNGAIRSKVLKDWVIMPVAQGVHWVDVKVKTTLMGAQKSKVYKLNEKIAVEYGAELISELFIYTLGTVILVYEYTRSVAKDYKKEQLVKDNTAAITRELEGLKTKSLDTELLVEQHCAEIRGLNRQIGQLHGEIRKIKDGS